MLLWFLTTSDSISDAIKRQRRKTKKMCSSTRLSQQRKPSVSCEMNARKSSFNLSPLIEHSTLFPAFCKAHCLPFVGLTRMMNVGPTVDLNLACVLECVLACISQSCSEIFYESTLFHPQNNKRKVTVNVFTYWIKIL